MSVGDDAEKSQAVVAGGVKISQGVTDKKTASGAELVPLEDIRHDFGFDLG